ncbi:MAG: YciI family protein [candidate division Zixibacteria bacterium]|nr:YciI family protein [candidate division Zixibacteria bacterium]MCI0596218.1 YciI family protein [candidate division Zixibacteria bacterium]
MQYVCLCYEEEKKLKEMPKREWEGIVRETYAYNEELRQKGHLITSQALQSVQAATTVRVRNGKLSTTDGPFAETKEQLGGFFVIEAQDLNEAVRVASRLSGARLGCIEVRPVMELS